MSLSSAVFILVVLLVVGWFALGTQFNVRRGNEWLRWMEAGLPLAGEKTTLRWLGSSVVELKIQQAHAPFREVSVLLVLEPRDVAPLWALARWRGRRDLFLFRAALRLRPRVELEALNPRSWFTRGVEHRCRQKNWVALPAPEGLVAYTRGDTASAAQILQVAEVPECPLVRLAVHQVEPHFEAQWELRHLRGRSSRAVFETLCHLARSL